MAVVRWDPWGELASLQRDVQELFGRTSSERRAGGLIPPMDAYRTDDGLVVRFELPGLTEDQVEVNFQKGVLTVSGERPADADVQEGAWLRRERPVGSFSRSITLSDSVDASGITASFANGLLELRIPAAADQGTHRIPISGGASHQTVDVSEQPTSTNGRQSDARQESMAS